MNFAFYVSGNAGTLKKILKNNSPVLKDTKVVIIDSKPSKDLLRYLETLNIKCIFREYDLSFSDFMLNILLNDKIDYCFCFGHHILLRKLIEVFKNKIIKYVSIIKKYL